MRKAVKAAFCGAALGFLTTSAHAQNVADVLIGKWDWVCCKNNIFYGQIDITKFEKGVFIGTMGEGPRGGGVVITIPGEDRIKMTRTTKEGCTEDNMHFQEWEGKFDVNPPKYTITGTITGCNTNDPNIREFNKFVIYRIIPPIH